MKELGLKNPTLQKALGYPMPNVIAMMKGGTMRLPITKVPAAAALLQVDPIFLLSKVIAENDAELWEVIAAHMGNLLVTQSEMELIKLVRRGLNGHDVNLTQSVDFVCLIEPALAAIARRESALSQAVINRKDD